MSYKNLINVSCASIAEVQRHILDWLTSYNGIADYSATGLGWTLHDFSFASSRDTPAAGDWAVVSSIGEDGKQSLYYRLLDATLANSIIQCRAGLYWNATTNAFVVGYPGADQTGGPTTGTTFSLWIYGSLNHFYIVIGNGTTNYGRAFALPIGQANDTTIATTTSAVSAGVGVVVPFDSVPAAWIVGSAVYMRSAGSVEKTTITDISGLNVTMTLANAYGSGSLCSADFCGGFISYLNNFVDSGRVLIGRSGLITDPGQTVLGEAHSIILSSSDPDLNNNCHIPEVSKIYNTSYGYSGYMPDLLEVSQVGITSGNVYPDPIALTQWRALLIDSHMYLFREV